MILSVIIVNYNVKYFLEQCLCSVESSLRGLGGAAEIIVVDNSSRDGSMGYLRPKFPGVKFLVNEDNPGFARANNQALETASGKYILFLNPDTILSEDTCAAGVAFLESTPGAGAMGMRMVDGSGRFLRESRRGFPSPWVAFCKLAGLTALFPRSRFLAGYYMDHLPERSNHPAPILSGACFWTSRQVLDKAGSFDEQFFMYAEDIDLSYRIEQAGFVNYYFAGTTILHFKGESTRKDALYIKLFYKAMSQFRRKHFRGSGSALFNIVVEMAIRMKAALTAALRALSAVFRFGGPQKPSPVRTGNPGARSRKTWITGDSFGAQELEERLPADPARILVSGDLQTEVPAHADEIFYCQGNDFTFGQFLDALQENGRRAACKIHAAGSGSVTGSHSKDGQGETIALPEQSGAAEQGPPVFK